MTVGQRISKIMTEAGLNQKEFAEQIGVSSSTMSRLIKDQQEVSRPVLVSIQARFGASADWIETGIGDPYPVKDIDTLIHDLTAVLQDNPALLRFLTAVSARMTAQDWRSLNDFVDSLGGVL